ncbi:MAG: XRE family transcriptional regulator [Campylobacteraceae bacterium]|nr:XRE family transcriptional regulator [Campylobacteraceae bacterium]
MNTKDIINLLHISVEAQQLGRRISHKEMAKFLGVSMRTYQEWRLGNSSPMAINAVFKMLGYLDDEDIVRLVKRIKHNQRDSLEQNFS